MRQNPIQQKRGAMSVKLRVASAPSANAPQLPVALPAPTPIPVDVPRQPVEAPVPMPSAPIQPLAPTAVAENIPKIETPEVSGGQSDPYSLSNIFVALLSGARKSEIIPLLRAGLAKAKERGDDLFITVFEGGIAANQALPDARQAIEAYHRAFDLCERRADAPIGFLHSMVWSLYTSLGDGAEIAELMERARRTLKRDHSSTERNNELLREVWTEFETLPEFSERVESYRTAQETESAPVINKLLRESRLSPTRTMLLFPRCWQSRRANDVRSFSSVVSPTFGNYFFWRNGFGTVINPSLSFVDDFYRIGGVLRDIHNVVFTVSPSSSENPLSQFRTLFGLLRQANVMQSVRFFVRPSIAEENGDEFRRLESSGMVESIHSLRNGVESELLGDGGSLVFRNNSFLLSLPEDRKIQFLDYGAEDLEGQSQELGAQCDLMVLPVETVEELVWASRQIRQHQPGLAVFDLPKEGSHLILLDPSVRSYVNSASPIAYADSALVLDVLAERFVDCVKVFGVSEHDCWTENTRLSFDPAERQLPEGLLYFEQGAEPRFADEHSEIIEAFLYNRRRRRGLYFA